MVNFQDNDGLVCLWLLNFQRSLGNEMVLIVTEKEL